MSSASISCWPLDFPKGLSLRCNHQDTSFRFLAVRKESHGIESDWSSAVSTDGDVRVPFSFCLTLFVGRFHTLFQRKEPSIDLLRRRRKMKQFESFSSGRTEFKMVGGEGFEPPTLSV